MRRSEKQRYWVPLEIYLKLTYSSSAEKRARILRDQVEGHPGTPLALPALEKDAIDKLVGEHADKSELVRTLVDLEDKLRSSLTGNNAGFLPRLEELLNDLRSFLESSPNHRTALESQLVEDLSELLRLLGLKKLHANLEGVQLNEGFNLDDVDLSGANLENAILSGIKLRCAILSDAELTRVCLSDADLTNAQLKNSNLTHANLERATLKGADFQGAETMLVCTIFKHANLSDAKLQGLRRTNFRGPDSPEELTKENIEENIANITRELESISSELATGLSEDNGSLSDEQREQRRRLEERRQQIEGESQTLELLLEGLRGEAERTNFSGACLRYANLQGTDLSNCDVEGIYIGGAQVGETILQWKKLVGIGGKIGEEADARKLRIEHVIGDNHQQGWRIRYEDEDSAKSFLHKDETLREEMDDYHGNYNQKVFFHRSRALFYKEAKEGYSKLKQNFAGTGDAKASTKAYLKERETERLEAKMNAWAAFHEGDWNFLKYLGKNLRDLAVRLLCGYGESLGWVFLNIALVFFVFAAIYGLFGVKEVRNPSHATEQVKAVYSVFDWCVDEGEKQKEGSLLSPSAVADLSLFSLGSMTTMAPNGMEPLCPWVEFATRVEALLAIALTGLFGFVLGNRVRRR